MNLHRESFFSFFWNMVLMAVTIASTIVIVRTLGPEGRGLYSVVNSFAVLATMLLTMGLPWANTWIVSRHRRLLKFVLSNTISFAILLLFVLLPAAYIFQVPLEKILKFPMNGVLFISVVFLIPVMSLVQTLNAIMLGLKKIIEYSFVNCLVYILFLILCATAAMSQQLTLDSMILYFLLSWGITAFYLTWRISRFEPLTLFPHKVVFFSALKQVGLKAQSVNILGALLQRMDIFIINYFHGIQFAGFYSLAMFMGQMTYQIPTIIGNIIFPLATDDSKLQENQERVVRLIHLLLVIHIVLFGTLLPTGKYLFNLLYGHQYSGCFAVFQILYPGFIFASLSIIINSFLAGRGYPSVIVKSASIGTACSVFLNLALVPTLNIIGAAIAFSTAYLIMFFLLAQYFATNYGQSLLQLFLLPKVEQKHLFNQLVRLEFISKIRNRKVSS